MFAVNTHTYTWRHTHTNTHRHTNTEIFPISEKGSIFLWGFLFISFLYWKCLWGLFLYSPGVKRILSVYVLEFLYIFFFYKSPDFHLFLYYSYKWIHNNIWKFVLCSLIYYNPSCLCSTGFSFFRKNSPMCHLLLSYFPSGPFYMLPVCFFIFIILNFAIFMSVMRYNPKGGGCHHIYSLFACYSFFSSFKKHPCIWLEHTWTCSSMRPIKF